jgi:hypothetical protein
MKSRQTAFTRVAHDGHTICVDTCYVNDPARLPPFYETAARIDPSVWVETRTWHIFEQYQDRAQALAGHARWAQKVREHGVPESAQISAARKTS